MAERLLSFKMNGLAMGKRVKFWVTFSALSALPVAWATAQTTAPVTAKPQPPAAQPPAAQPKGAAAQTPTADVPPPPVVYAPPPVMYAPPPVAYGAPVSARCIAVGVTCPHSWQGRRGADGSRPHRAQRQVSE